MPTVVSTMTHDVNYTLWKSNPGGVNVVLKKVLIKGGHGVAKRTPDGGLKTAVGVETKVTDDELELLEKDETFRTHKKFGAVKVLKAAASVTKAIKDMNQKAPDAPLNDGDFKKGGRVNVPDEMKLNSGRKIQ